MHKFSRFSRSASRKTNQKRRSRQTGAHWKTTTLVQAIDYEGSRTAMTTDGAHGDSLEEANADLNRWRE